MESFNPFKSPETKIVPDVPDFQPRFDAGKLTAIHLLLFATLSVIWLVVSVFFFDSFHFDFSPLLCLWAAFHLNKHHRSARSWVVFVCWANLIGICIFNLVIPFIGIEHLVMRPTIVPPTLPNLWTVSAILCVIVGIPLWLLYTPEAKREFGIK